MLNGGISNNTGNDNKSGSTQNDEIGHVHNSVPTDLKTLIRIVLRTFYDFELFLCMEMLMLYPCIKEEDLAELLRLDLKVVHQYLLNLKREKFINEKSIMETNSSDGKQSKHSYFYINYKMMVNVIKYKLDKIRIQIESEENQFTTRANFKCTLCKKTYSDLDTKDIFLTMQCLYCGAEVDEDTSSLPTRSARNLLNKFNTQMKDIFELLSKVEHIRLADCILRPGLVDMTEILERITNSSGTNNSKNSMQLPNGKSALLKNDKWSGEKTRNVDIFGQTTISINFDSTDGINVNNRKCKELPSILLLNRTQEDDLDNVNNRDSILLNSVMKAADETIIDASNKLGTKDSPSIDSIQPFAIINTNTSSTNIKLNSSNLSSTPSNLTNLNNSNGQSANLEAIIMQKLLKYEKKIESSSLNSESITLSNDLNEKSKFYEDNKHISVSKKRNLDEKAINGVGNQINLINNNMNTTAFEQDETMLQKKRRLNNGGM